MGGITGSVRSGGLLLGVHGEVHGAVGLSKVKLSRLGVGGSAVSAVRMGEITLLKRVYFVFDPGGLWVMSGRAASHTVSSVSGPHFLQGLCFVWAPGLRI